MKRYEKYKDSGIEWIGEIPKRWQLKRIKHTTYVKGRIGWKGLRSDEFLEQSDSFVVTGTDFRKGRIKWGTCYQVPQERYDEDPFIQLKENDLLITKDGTIGKIAVVKDMPKIATLNSGVFVTRPKTEDYTSEFMYWLLESDVFRSFYDFNKSGSTIQHLYQNVFNEFKFTCPTIDEQTQIVNYLHHKTQQIDALIEKRERLIALLEEERTAIINQAVTKGLDPNVKMKDSGIDWLGEIPEHWKTTRINRIIKVKDGTHDSPSQLSPNENTFPLITSKDFKGGKIDFDNAKHISEEDHKMIYRRSNTEYGDILMSMIGGNIGNMILVDTQKEFSIKNVCLFKTTGDSLRAKHLYYILKSALLPVQIDLNSRGGAQGFLSLGDLRGLIYFVLPKKELQKITDFLENKIEQIDLTKRKLEKEICLIKEYKTTLISDVVTGKIDVRQEVVN